MKQRVRNWRVRYLVHTIAMAVGGIAMGFALAEMLPDWSPTPVAAVALVVIAVNAYLSYRLHREIDNDYQQAMAEMDVHKAELATLVTDMAAEAERRRKRQAPPPVVHADAFEVDLESGNLIAVRDPGIMAIMLDAVAESLRDEALDQAADRREDRADGSSP